MIVAIAGGTGDIGSTVVEELTSAGKHDVVVLTRKLPSNPEAGGPKFVVVDYANVGGLVRALENNNVHTVISAMAIEGPSEQAQLNLIAAAGKSSTTRRLIPSEFVAYTPDGDDANADEMTAPILRARKALAAAGLETTYVANSVFMDYFGQPNIPSNLRLNLWAVDVPSRRAVIPGTGDDVITMTYSKDFARFVARLIDDDSWPKFSNISGSDTTLNEIVAIAEKITGDKFTLIYDSIKDMSVGKATPVNPYGASYNGIDPAMMAAMLGSSVVQGSMKIPEENRLNDRYPDIKPTSIEDLMKMAWSK